MKSPKSYVTALMITFFSIFINITPAITKELDFSTYDELINNISTYESGDIININADITATQNTGNIFPAGGGYTINGTGNDFLGAGFSGFNLPKGTDLIFKNFENVSGFSSSEKGGVFQNTGVLSLNNSNFSSNTSTYGGVIYNTGTTNINNSTFSNNGTNNFTINGGALCSEAGTLNITNSTFSNNTTRTNIFSSYGGAIASTNTIINLTNSTFENNNSGGYAGALSTNAYTTIRDSVFKNNTALNHGGAIFVRYDMLVSNSLFEGNEALMDGSGYGYNGGAIRAESGNILINNSTFNGNIGGWGGAISTDTASNLVIINSIFENNESRRNTSANVSGGAVTNGSTLLVVNSIFRNNSSKSNGGGINFNGTVLNIGANGTGSVSTYGNSNGNTIFEGNTAAGISNGLTVYQDGYGTPAPIVNLNAGNGGSIIFNDAVVVGSLTDSSAQNRSPIIFNINNAIEYNDSAGHIYPAPTDGIVLFNNIVGGRTRGIINLYDGILKIGDNGGFTNMSINFDGGLLETRNNISDVIRFNDFSIKKDTNWRMDIDLAASSSDYIDIANTPTAENNASLIIETIRLKSDFTEADKINGIKEIYFSNKNLGDAPLASLIYDNTILTYVTTNSTYSVETGFDNSGSKLSFDYKGEGGLPYAVSLDGTRVYSGTGDEEVTAWVNDNNALQGQRLIIWGNDYSVKNTSGGDLQGLVVGTAQNNQTFEINDVNSWSGFSNSYEVSQSAGNTSMYGGALAVVGSTENVSTININNVDFNNNHVGSADNRFARSYGGAIAFSNSSSSVFANIIDSSFANNSVFGRDAYGGAISVTLANLSLTNTLFSGNTAYSTMLNSSNGMNAYGGAIYVAYNSSNLYINKSGFYGNSADTFSSGGGYQNANGGAISTENNTTAYIDTASFVNNHANGYNAYGGAINNNGIMTINDSIFTNNYTQATGTSVGGAINNTGTLNILATNNNTTFSGNYIEKVQRDNNGNITSLSKDSQALFNTSTVNMNAADGYSVIFYDKIDGNNSTININQSGITLNDYKTTSTAPTDGNVVFNNTVKNQTLNLYNGVMCIGKDPTSLASGDTYMENVSLNTYGGTLDLQNNQIDNITFENLSLNGNLLFDFDVDLTSRTSDFLSINNDISGSGNIVIDTINVIVDMKEGINHVQTPFINKTANVIIADTSKTIATNDYIYNVSLITNNTELLFERASASLGLPEAVARPDVTDFDMTRDELVGQWIEPTLNNMQGDLTIYGNKYSIIAENNLEGIVTNGFTLNVIEVGNVTSEIFDSSMRNFDNALTNNDGGKINIVHSVFTNNIAKNTYVDLDPPLVVDDVTTQLVGGNGAAIENKDGIVNIDGAIFNNNKAENFGGAIYNNSELNLTASEGNGVLFNNNSALVVEPMNSYANDIYQTADGYTTMDGTGGMIYIGSGIAGEGTIIKQGSNELVLASNSDSSRYKGEFILTDGSLTVNSGAGFFGGNSEVTGGNLNWDTDSTLLDTAKLVINGGNLNVLSNGHMYFDNDKVNIRFSNAFVNIQEGGVFENISSEEITIAAGMINGYNDGTSTTYGTFQNSGSISLVGDNSVFKGTFLQTQGTTDLKENSTLFFNGDLQGGSIVFNGNSSIKEGSTFTSANSDTAKTVHLIENTNSSSIVNAIANSNNKNLSLIIENNNDTLQTTTVDNIKLDEGIISLTLIDNVAYEGDITVGDGASLNLQANNYDMQFNDNIVDINGSSKFNIFAGSDLNGQHSITIGGNSTITGDAQTNGGGIIKEGDGKLVLDGDASAFSGNFTQFGGTTEVTSNGFLFGGTKDIKGGELIVNSNTGVYYNDVILSENTTLTHNSILPAGGTINTDTFSFGADAVNSKANFKGDDNLNVKVNYTLGANIENGNNNTISFNDSRISLGTEDFTGSTTYEFNNSVIDFSSASSDFKDYVFSNLDSQNSSIDLKITFVDDSGTIKLQTDTLKVDSTNVAGGNVIELGNILIKDASLENGSGIYNTVKDVLQGEATFKAQEPITLVAEGATTIYEYQLSLTNDKHSIYLDNVGAADETSLNKINVKNINRFFNFSKGQEGQPEYYYNYASLDPMGTGNFTVSGSTDTPSASILSGILTQTSQPGSLFNIDKNSNFTMQNLTVENTYKDGNGSVVSIGTETTQNTDGKALLQNIIVQNAESVGDGGALFNNGGVLNLVDSGFYENKSQSNGGVLHNKSGNVNIYNSVFGSDNKGNTAISGGAISTESGSNTQIAFSDFSNNSASSSGGAIFNNGSLTLTESNTFSDNKAVDNRGGAIYNNGNLVISSKTGSDTLFENNNDNKGKNDIYQTSNATTIISGEGGKIGINSGFAGEGEIIKDGINELILGKDSVNSEFLGDFKLKNGVVTVNGDFFGGNSTVNAGTLNWNSATDKSNSSVLVANGGTVAINGKLTLNNQNDALNEAAKINLQKDSALNIEDGYVSFDRNGNSGDFENYDKWNGAVIQNGGIIDYNIDSNGLIQSSQGSLNINGGNLTLSDVEFNGQNYTSFIADTTNVSLNNNSALTLASPNVSLTLNTGDTWSQDATVNVQDGIFNYTDNIGNGKLNAQGGTVNVVGSDLVLKDVDDTITKGVQFNLDNNSMLNISAGNVTLDSADILKGAINLDNTGKLNLDGFVNNANNEGTVYTQNGGTLSVNNNSQLTISNPQSSITGGDISVDNSQLIIGSDINASSITNLNLQNNAIFNTLQALNVTNNLKINNSYLSTINNSIETNNIENLIVSSGTTANFGIDVNAKAQASDEFIVGNIFTDAYNNGVINIGNINLIGGSPVNSEFNLQIFDSQNISDKIVFSSTATATTALGQYNLSSLGGGLYNMKLASFNPQIFRGQVATMAAYQNQLLIDNIVLNHIMLVGHNIIATDDQNRYSATLPQFAPYQYSHKDGGIWYKSFMNLEKLDMTQNLSVGNNAYGALVGMDFPLINLKNGWKFIPTAYIAYNGGHQHFNGVSMYQDGGQGGIMGTLLKNNFIGSVMAYGGGYGNSMSGQGYTDRTGNWFAGTAAKFAYNLNVSKHFTIQPTAFVSYNAFGQQNWNSQFGILSMNSGLLNGINTAPGVNFIYSRENWSVYATFQYMFNINDRITGRAGNVNLPAIKMDHGYIEYGLGATRQWKERFNAYGQITLRNGGRTGIGFQLGLEYFFDLSELKNIANLFKRKNKVQG